MKKVFLFFASALAVCAAQAGNTLSYDGCDLVEGTAGAINIAFNSYGSSDADGGYQWQASDQDIIAAAVDAFEEGASDSYSPALGQIFTLKMTCSVNADLAKFQAAIVDEREVAKWWSQLTEMTTKENIAKGEEFEFTAIMAVNCVEIEGDPEPIALTAPGLLLAAEMANGVAAAEFGTDNPIVVTVKSCSFSFMPAIAVEGEAFMMPFSQKQGEAFQYQGAKAGIVAAKDCEAGKYVNVSIDAKLLQAGANNIQFALVSASPEDWFKVLTDEDKAFKTFAANVAKDGAVKIDFSLPLIKSKNSDMETADGASMKAYIIAESDSETSVLVLDMKKFDVTISDAPKYSEPTITAVEEVTAEVAIENGVVYSAGSIVVYNVAGQVVATANQEFNVNALEAGVYFISTAEGTAKIVK